MARFAISSLEVSLVHRHRCSCRLAVVTSLWQTIIERLLGWPVAVSLLGLILRRPLGQLLDRIEVFKVKGVGVEGEVSTSGKANQQLEATNRASEKDPLLLRPGSQQLELSDPKNVAKRESAKHWGGEAPLLLEQIQTLKDDLAALRFPLNTPETTEVLIRHLAVTQLLHRGEVLYRVIFGSQLAAMHKLNVKGPLTEAEIRPLYEKARNRYPRFYADYTFEQWMGFLLRQNGVVRENDQYMITLYGREFLSFVTGQGLPKKIH
jgi:hypothetical protein